MSGPKDHHGRGAGHGITRRRFFAIAAGAGAWAAMPKSAFSAPVPVLMGDGVHDDTDGLNAACNGRPFEDRSGGAVVIKDGRLSITGATFATSGLVYVNPPQGVQLVKISGCTFIHTAPLVFKAHSVVIIGGDDA